MMRVAHLTPSALSFLLVFRSLPLTRGFTTPSVARSSAASSKAAAAAAAAAVETSSSRLFLSNDASDEDLSRWEQMYNQGEPNNNNNNNRMMNLGDEKLELVTPNDGSIRSSSSSSSSMSQVRVVTFDLDNTLWKTGPTIQAANDALATYLDAKSIVQPERVEIIMGQLFQLSKSTYSPLSGDDPKSPVLLTQLRKDALQKVLEDSNGYTTEDAAQEAERAFEIWTTARHEALPHFFAASVIPCLERIRAIGSSSTSSNTNQHQQPVLIGAITDGNSDPRTVPMLRPFFDFVVNAEGVGISKPDRRVYLAAIQKAAVHPYVQDLFGDTAMLDDLEDIVGPWWVHIGDDFLKDIVAAKGMGMRSIWAKELVQDTPDSVEAKKKPTKSIEEFVKDVSDKLAASNVVEMAVGADDYLAESLEAEFADATVDTFAEVGETLLSWHAQATATTALLGMVDSNQEEAAQQTEEKPAAASEPQPSTEKSSTSSGDSKFCMSCGTKLPINAQFCSLCGEKQG